MKKEFVENVTNASGSLKVDRKHGVIRNVKVLGLVSENGRRYLPEAVKEAADLYEGVRVNVDHPEGKPTDQRSAYDRFGKLENIRWVEGEGLYGDLVFLRSHPMAERICEAAERMPDVFGLSHNAGGDGDYDKDGVFVVKNIVEVRHVDLVADPATTKSLQESRQTKPLRESRKMDDNLKEALNGVKEAMGKLEAYYKEADGEDKEKDMKEAEEEKKETSEGEDKKDMEEADLEIEVGDDEKDSEDDKQPMEGKKGKLSAKAILQENKRLKAREAVRQLCESAGLKATTQLLADLALLPADAAKRTINQLSIAAKAAKPKSSSPVLESKQKETANGIPDGGDDLFNWIQN